MNSANFFKCLTLISMKEWFHKNNMKDAVNSANSLVAETLELLHTCFPWWDKDGNKDGQGWAVSKLHGVAKFVLYMKLFGNAINFLWWDWWMQPQEICERNGMQHSEENPDFYFPISAKVLWRNDSWYC